MPEKVITPNDKMLLNLDITQGYRYANSGRQDTINTDASKFLDAVVPVGVTAPTHIQGLQDNALAFNGNSAISLADHAMVDVGTKSFAINFELQSSNLSEVDMIVDKRDSNGIGYALSNNNGQLQLTLKGTNSSQVINLPSDTFSSNLASEDWQMVTVNVNRNIATQVSTQLFINGVQQGTTLVTVATLGDLENTAPLTIGATSAGMTGTGLNAALDNVRLVDRVMTTDEISRLARTELTTNLNPITNRTALWSLDEAVSGMAADSAGQNDLTHINSPTIIQGKVDHAVQLNATDASKQRLTAPDNVNLDLGTSDFTLGLWVKSSNVSQLDKIAEKLESNKGYSLYNDNGKIGLQLMDGSQNVKFELTTQQSAQLLNNSWQHLSVSVDRTPTAIQEVKFFANGTLITSAPAVIVNNVAQGNLSTPIAMGNLDNASILSIGSSSSPVIGSATNFFNGAIDEVQIMKSELSQTQIQNLVNPQELLLTNSLVDSSPNLVGSTRAELLMGLTVTNNLYQSNTFNAGAGNDILTGINPTDVQPGLREKDQLMGGVGADKFVLGDTSKAYYLTDNFTLTGNNSGRLDYALIQDFKTAELDKIELFGKASDYELRVVSGTQTEIYRNLNTNVIGGKGDDLVAIVQHDATPLSLTNLNQFTLI